jgi:uncharacterized membrane protein YhaH (DUF805 family)
MNWIFLYNGFHGRIGRQTFWIAMVVLAVAEFIAHVIADQIEGDRLGAIVDLAFTYPEFAVSLKRAHDRNLPPWLIMAFFALGAMLDLFTVLGVAGSDEMPSMLALTVAVPFSVGGIALLIELGFRRGTVGPNDYGPDPLAKS